MRLEALTKTDATVGLLTTAPGIESGDRGRVCLHHRRRHALPARRTSSRPTSRARPELGSGARARGASSGISPRRATHACAGSWSKRRRVHPPVQKKSETAPRSARGRVRSRDAPGQADCGRRARAAAGRDALRDVARRHGIRCDPDSRPSSSGGPRAAWPTRRGPGRPERGTDPLEVRPSSLGQNIPFAKSRSWRGDRTHAVLAEAHATCHSHRRRHVHSGLADVNQHHATLRGLKHERRARQIPWLTTHQIEAV